MGSLRLRRPLSNGDGNIEKEREPHQCRRCSEAGRHAVWQLCVRLVRGQMGAFAGIGKGLFRAVKGHSNWGALGHTHAPERGRRD